MASFRSSLFLSSLRLTPVIAIVLLAGCTTAPKQTPAARLPVATPTEWQQAPVPASVATAAPLDTAALANWWNRFDDPVLNHLVTDALANSPDIRTALSKIEESRAVRGVTKAALLPSVSAGVSGQGNRTRNRRTDTTTTSENYGASLDASWEVDLFGKNRLTLSAADADLAQTADNFHAAQVTLAAEVASAYITLRAAEARLVVVQRSISTRQETLQLTEWREQAGTGNALDSQQSISSLEQARATVPTIQQTVTETRNQLALLSGKTPGALDALLSPSYPLPVVPLNIVTGIPAETLRQRPDVRASEHAVEAATARTRAARRERFPTLTLSGSIGVEALKAGRLFSPEAITSSVLGSLVAPIFDGGRIRQTITIQTEQENQSLIAYESTVLTALSEVENALVAVQRTSESLAILNRATAAAREAASLASLQYEAGQTDLLTVLDAQRTLLSLEEQTVTTAANELNAHIQLYKSLGGGWSVPAAQTTATPAASSAPASTPSGSAATTTASL